MLKRMLFVGLLLLALSVGVVSAQDGEPLKIGLLTDTSGPLTIYGVELQNGFELGIDYATGGTMEVAGRPIEIVVRDNGSDADTGASQARELLESEGVEVLVGAPSSGVTVGLQAIAADYDVILMAGPAASPAITGANFNPNTFQICRNSYHDFLAFASYALENLGNQFIQLAPDYEFGRASAGAAEAVLGSAGIEFPQGTIYAPTDTTDFTPYLQQIIDSGADAVIISWAGDSTVTLFQQIAELGVADTIPIVAAFNSNDIMAATDPSLVGTVSWMIYHYSFPDNEINDWLVENHRDRYDNDVPDLFTECGFAIAQALVAGLEATEGDTAPEALAAALEGMQFEGPKGTYYIRPGDHRGLVPMYVAKLVNLDDPDFRYYELLQTIPALDIIPPCELTGDYADRCAMNDDAMEQWMAESEDTGNS
jgi:branched-chain amino acid transport system substrate-binding protein